ncbi:hypothetical protein WDW89_14915 [Deltaproteobacteria bacterium TL4]
MNHMNIVSEIRKSTDAENSLVFGEDALSACPCDLEKAYAKCCEPLIKGVRKASTPEELMFPDYFYA